MCFTDSEGNATHAVSIIVTRPISSDSLAESIRSERKKRLATIIIRKVVSAFMIKRRQKRAFNVNFNRVGGGAAASPFTPAAKTPSGKWNICSTAKKKPQPSARTPSNNNNKNNFNTPLKQIRPPTTPATKSIKTPAQLQALSKQFMKNNTAKKVTKKNAASAGVNAAAKESFEFMRDNDEVVFAEKCYSLVGCCLEDVALMFNVLQKLVESEMPPST